MNAPCDHVDGTEWVDGICYCLECGEPLDQDDNREPGDPDGECFRGGEASAYLAEQQAWIQKNLK